MSGDTEVTYANGRAAVQLQGRQSAKLKLALVAPGTQLAGWQSVAWDPKDRGVHDLEVSARISTANGTLGAVCKVLWWAELGTADVNYREPIAAPPNGAGTIVQPMVMANHGMRLRVNARSVKLGFQGVLVSGAANWIELSVAISPTSTGPDAPQFPRVSGGLAAQRCAIPMSATQWRFREPDGTAFGAGGLVPVGPFGDLIGPLVLSDYAEFSPIHLQAQTYIAGADHIVEWA